MKKLCTADSVLSLSCTIQLSFPESAFPLRNLEKVADQSSYHQPLCALARWQAETQTVDVQSEKLQSFHIIWTVRCTNKHTYVSDNILSRATEFGSGVTVVLGPQDSRLIGRLVMYSWVKLSIF